MNNTSGTQPIHSKVATTSLAKLNSTTEFLTMSIVTRFCAEVDTVDKNAGIAKKVKGKAFNKGENSSFLNSTRRARKIVKLIAMPG